MPTPMETPVGAWVAPIPPDSRMRFSVTSAWSRETSSARAFISSALLSEAAAAAGAEGAMGAVTDVSMPGAVPDGAVEEPEPSPVWGIGEMPIMLVMGVMPLGMDVMGCI